MKSALTSKCMAVAIWLSRLIVGGTFVVSGWAKTVDPRGFVYKIEEYLAVWGLDLPRELILVGAVALALVEFTVGILVVSGSLRRAAVICAAAMMAFMLPLTAYIYLADPVADCGCFGDLWVISNGATLLKNIFLTALIIFLLIFNKRCAPGFRPGLQWLVIALSIIYGLIVAVIGWNVQPMVDFRPYPVGSTLNATADEAAPLYIYSRAGETRTFGLDELPDSTWTFVGPDQSSLPVLPERLAVFDGDEEVTDDVLPLPGDDGETIILAVPEIGLDYLMRARFANELSAYEDSIGGRMIALVSASGDALERWISIARPDFEVYTASDTSLKQLVRGDGGFVLLHGDTIMIKRNFATLAPDLLERDKPFDDLYVVDNGRLAKSLTLCYIAGLALLWLTGMLFGRRKDPRKSILKKNVKVDVPSTPSEDA